MDYFTRSWQLAKRTFHIIWQDPEMMWYPFISVVLSVIWAGVVAVPNYALRTIAEVTIPLWGDMIFVFAYYLGLSTIGTFMSVAVIFIAGNRFSGNDATFWEGWNFAKSRFHQILQWGVLTAIIGVVLQLLEKLAERLGGIGELLLSLMRSVLGAAWNIASLFVPHVIVYEGTGPFTSLKRSVQVLHKTWGEALIRMIGFGFIQILIVAPFFVVLIFATVVMESVTLAIPALVLFLAVSVATWLVFSVADSVFLTALYLYAKTGKVAGRYSEGELQSAFDTRDTTVFS